MVLKKTEFDPIVLSTRLEGLEGLRLEEEARGQEIKSVNEKEGRKTRRIFLFFWIDKTSAYYITTVDIIDL